MEIHVGKTKVKGISRDPSPLKIMIDQKQLENVNYFNHLGNMTTNDARCTRGIEFRIVMTKAAFNRKKESFHLKIGLKFKEETSEMLHLEHRILWC